MVLQQKPLDKVDLIFKITALSLHFGQTKQKCGRLPWIALMCLKRKCCMVGKGFTGRLKQCHSLVQFSSS